MSNNRRVVWVSANTNGKAWFHDDSADYANPLEKKRKVIVRRIVNYDASEQLLHTSIQTVDYHPHHPVKLHFSICLQLCSTLVFCLKQEKISLSLWLSSSCWLWGGTLLNPLQSYTADSHPSSWMHNRICIPHCTYWKIQISISPNHNRHHQHHILILSCLSPLLLELFLGNPAG